jgi:hypothetical protein
VITGCRERFEKFLQEPDSLAPDLRAPVLTTVARHADEQLWTTIHQLAQRTTSLEQKQEFYDALAAAADPQLIRRTLQFALKDELPASRALMLVAKVAKESGRPDIAWEFARANMQQLLAKSDALGALQYAPGLFTFFSDTARAEELREFASKNLPAAAESEVAKAVDEVTFRADFRARLLHQLRPQSLVTPPSE